MGKVETLKEKFPKIREVSFNRIVKEDLTPTKKYLEVMLKFWSKKSKDYISSIKYMGNTIKKFEELLPYIENKDIYSSYYYRFSVVEQTIFDAEKIKFEKTFNREEHINVIFEDDNILFLQPKTHVGSLKYGSNTKWCTASRGDTKTFNNYINMGFLFYLIDKIETKRNNYNKVAFHTDNKKSSILSHFNVYNQSDNCVTDDALIRNGWDYELILGLVTRMRYYVQMSIDDENLKRDVKSDISTLENFNFQRFYENLSKLRVVNDTEPYKNFQPILDKFIEKIKGF